MTVGFHESYYEHACRVVTERDVLDIQFKEATFYNAFRKKYHDLFLLSYSDGRAGDLYNSTHAMRLGRYQQFQRHLGTIHPLSKFRNFWDMFILHVFIFHLLLLYLNTTLLFKRIPVATCYIAMLLEVFMLVDILINARTGFINTFTKTVELEKKLILKNYCSKKIFFHAMSAIPLAFILFLRYGNGIHCTLCKANYFNCIISFLTIINLFRVYELSSYWERDRTTYIATFFFHLLRICVNSSLITAQIFQYSDTISLIYIMETETKSSLIYNDSFFDHIFIYIHTNTTTDEDDMSFLVAHFFRIVGFLGQSRSDLLLNMNYSFAFIFPDPLFRLISYCIVFFITCWLMLEIFYFMIRQTYFDDEILKTEKYLLRMVQKRQLPEQLYEKMKTFVHFQATKLKVIEIKNGLNKALPRNLNHDIAWHSFSRSILRIPFFNGWPRKILQNIAYLLEEHIFLKNDVIVEVGAVSQGLMIVDSGLLAVYEVSQEHSYQSEYSQYKEVEHLIDGDYFGQLSLVTDREVSRMTVVAITTCKILLLEKIYFRHLMRNDQDLFHSLREELQNELSKKA